MLLKDAQTPRSSGATRAPVDYPELYLIYYICFLSQLIVGVEGSGNLPVRCCFQADDEYVVPDSSRREFGIIRKRRGDLQRRRCPGRVERMPVRQVARRFR